MTSSPERALRRRSTRCRRRCRRCGGCASSATATSRGLMLAAFVAVAAGRAARRAARALAQAARRRRARARPAPASSPPPSASACRATATWFLRTVSTRVQRRFRDKVTIALESHVARLQASVATIAHHERPEYLDRLVGAAQPGVRARPHVHVAVLDLRLDPAPRRDGRAAGVDPPGARAARRLRAADGADLDLAARRRAHARRSAAPRRTAWPATCSRPRPRRRPARRCASPASASASSRTGAQAWERWYGPVSAARWGSAAWHTLAWAVFGAALRRRGRVRLVGAPRARRATCCSCSPPARGCRRTSARPSARSASCAASGWTARGASPGSRTTRRRSWPSADRARAGARCARASASSTCRSPIPAPTRLVLDDVDR